MRIALLSVLEFRVPPVGYGAIELVVSLLTEELVRRGHDVTLFASGDAITKAKLQAVCPRYLRGTLRSRPVLNLLNIATCLEQADTFDIIHNHVHEAMAFAGLVNTPMLTTLRGHLDRDWRLLFAHYRGWHCAISKSAEACLPEKAGFVGVIHNAIDVKSYPFNSGHRQPFLLFLSRISHEKGPHLAIEVAKRLRAKLVIAGNVDNAHYFKTMILPQVDGEQIQYMGEADYHTKRELMAQAYCLLAPITWEEPFGLFMAEAMACGTPVIAFQRGAAPEVVKHGVSGFVVNTIDEMVTAVGQVHQIDPRCCRAHVEDNFDVPMMVDRYLAAYQKVVMEASTSPSSKGS
jgi:glycosyltransferase involved in cell wall biosynthesis